MSDATWTENDPTRRMVQRRNILLFLPHMHREHPKKGSAMGNGFMPCDHVDHMLMSKHECFSLQMQQAERSFLGKRALRACNTTDRWVCLQMQIQSLHTSQRSIGANDQGRGDAFFSKKNDCSEPHSFRPGMDLENTRFVQTIVGFREIMSHASRREWSSSCHVAFATSDSASSQTAETAPATPSCA